MPVLRGNAVTAGGPGLPGTVQGPHRQGTWSCQCRDLLGAFPASCVLEVLGALILECRSMG